MSALASTLVHRKDDRATHDCTPDTQCRRTGRTTTYRTAAHSTTACGSGLDLYEIGALASGSRRRHDSAAFRMDRATVRRTTRHCALICPTSAPSLRRGPQHPREIQHSGLRLNIGGAGRRSVARRMPADGAAKEARRRSGEGAATTNPPGHNEVQQKAHRRCSPSGEAAARRNSAGGGASGASLPYTRRARRGSAGGSPARRLWMTRSRPASTHATCRVGDASRAGPWP